MAKEVFIMVAIPYKSGKYSYEMLEFGRAKTEFERRNPL